ncbi:hypothetical protein V6N13_134535 [Hibiscus sabdariffa]
MYWSWFGRLESSSSQPSSKNSNRRKPSPTGVLSALVICLPKNLGVESVTSKPMEARRLPSLRSGLTWPWPGNETRNT